LKCPGSVLAERCPAAPARRGVATFRIAVSWSRRTRHTPPVTSFAVLWVTSVATQPGRSN
jgi:hypothetical protein